MLAKGEVDFRLNPMRVQPSVLVMPRSLIPGFAFKEGRLWIFTEAEVIRIDGWSNLSSRRRVLPKDEWGEFIPPFRLLRPRGASRGAAVLTQPGPEGVPGRTVHAELERVAAFNGFRYTMPPEAAGACENFPARHWRLLKLCVLAEAAVELLNLNPVLGFCLAHHHALRKPNVSPDDFVKRVLSARQRDIAGWLGFPSDEAMVRIFRKIPVESLHLERMKQLRAVSHRPEARELLAHVPRINAGVQALVVDPLLLGHITPKLLAEVANSPCEMVQSEASAVLGMVAEMTRQMELPGVPRQFECLARLREVHDELAVELKRRKRLGLLSQPMPRPPLPGNDTIWPLTSTAMLIEEGETQKNCIASYARVVREGEMFIYRVLKPERATLAIARGSHADWEIAQMKLSCNREPSEKTFQAVQAWLRSYAMSA